MLYKMYIKGSLYLFIATKIMLNGSFKLQVN